jgi:tRNA (guanosine-2'-O-)-methyltransferase
MNKDEWMLNQFYEHVSENKQFLFEKIILDRTRHITIALENLFQPHNAAAVLRSCDCFGIQDVHIIENNNKYEPNKEIDMGSSKWLDLHKYSDLENNTVTAIQDLKSKGYQVIATTPHTDDCTIEELDISKPTALLFGTESTGLTKEAMDHADGFVRLPMYGFTESYNISVSVALALYDLTQRMRKNPEINWQLSTEEQLAIKLDWGKKVVKHGEKVEKIISAKFPND